MSAVKRRRPLDDIGWPEFMSDVLADLLGEYREIVKHSDLAPSSQYTYTNGAEQFVRWIKGEFTPGGALTPSARYDTRQDGR